MRHGWKEFQSALPLAPDDNQLNADGDLCLSGLIESRPSQIPLSDVTLATGARTHSLFDSRGHVFACGSGDDGVLGNGSTTGSPTPTALIGLPSSLSRSFWA
jgi:alpha-tubulin suppressor-like RCC1 family protein